MGESEQRLLVATDCLSEGVNLQDLFDSVVHYDLSWNPTRHQQREGRVDRFGQRAPLVRSALLYSPDSAIDGAVLDVILRKAEAIRKATGVTVPLPEERGAVTGALMNAVLLRKKAADRIGSWPSISGPTSRRWRPAGATPRRERSGRALGSRRTRSSRKRSRPNGSDGVSCWARRTKCSASSERAMARFNCAPGSGQRRVQGASRAPAEGAASNASPRGASRDTIRVAFDEPPPAGAELVTRSHPLPVDPGRGPLEGALDRDPAMTDWAVSGAWPTQRSPS